MTDGKPFLYTYLIPIVIFWLIIPLPFMMFNLGGAGNSFMESVQEINSIQNPNVLNYLTIFFAQFGFYLKMVFLWIDGLPLFFNIILSIFRVISWLIVLLAFRS